MTNLREAGNVRARLFTALIPLAGLLAACGGGGGGSDEESGDLFVLANTPTNGQETLTDLSDPGLGGALTVRFTSTPRQKDILDTQNTFNQLTPNVQILNQGFIRIPGTPSIDPATQSFSFTPSGGTLPAAQYTATFSKFITTESGALLNNGTKDFSTSWTVGPDIYPPVVRNITPAPLQDDTPIFTPIVITFNESLNPATVVYNQTVFVEDGGTNPPTPLLGTVTLDRDGFDIVFRPDPCVGMPPATTIVVRLYGAGTAIPPNPSFIQDRVGNGLVGDPNNSNQYSFQFNTKGVKQLPNPSVTPFPGYIRNFFTPLFTATSFFSTAAYASTQTTTYAFDTGPVSRSTFIQYVYNPGLTVQVLTNNRTYRLTLTGWALVGPFGGDFEAKLGQAGEGLLDWRENRTTGHTYIYQIDEAKEAVAIINTGTGAIEGHLNGVGTPKGITMGGGGLGATNLYVTNYGQGTVTMIPINKIQAGLPICTAVQELNDDISLRRYMATGRGPTGISTSPDWTTLGAVVNAGDNDMQIFDPMTLQPLDKLFYGSFSQKYPVGENPIDVAMSPFINGLGWIGWVVNQGGEDNPTGSVSLWYSSTGLVAPFSSATGAIQGTVSDGLNIPGRPFYLWLNPLTHLYVPNTGGDDVARLQVQVQGGAFFVTLQPSVAENIPLGTGSSPTSVTLTAINNSGADGTLVVALPGRGQVAFMNWQGSATAEVALFDLPGVRQVFSTFNY